MAYARSSYRRRKRSYSSYRRPYSRRASYVTKKQWKRTKVSKKRKLCRGVMTPGMKKPTPTTSPLTTITFPMAVRSGYFAIRAGAAVTTYRLDQLVKAKKYILKVRTAQPDLDVVVVSGTGDSESVTKMLDLTQVAAPAARPPFFVGNVRL